MAGWFDKTIKIIDLFSGLSTLDSYFVQASSALDYFYAYSKNETLLEMTPEELMNEKDLRVQYLQVDTKNRCIPMDWFIGYEAFTISTFIQLLGYGSQSAGGTLSTILR